MSDSSSRNTTISHASELLNEHEVRLQKVRDLRAVGIEPWPAFKPIEHTCADISNEFNTHAESKIYTIAGRLMTIRKHGKTAFAHLQDKTGILQIYLRADEMGDQFDIFDKYIDLGDIIAVTGTSFKTKMGEITLRGTSFTLLSKSLRPLPEKFHGLSDVEIKHRQRYLDLITSAESRERFKKRSSVVRIIRNFLDSHGYIEVETPMLHPIPGGAAARPFVTHHNALSQDMYMRIAPELYLKRLVVGGIDRVYEVNRNFRNEGISTRHNPEFTMLEFYTAHQDFHEIMHFLETMIKTMVQEVCGAMVVPFGQHMLDFEKPFVSMTMQEAVARKIGCAPLALEGKSIDTYIDQYAIELANKNASWGAKLVALFEELVESTLIQPTFITDFPVEVSPLSKRDPNNPAVASRYELFIAGMELSNGFNELNDPEDQAARFHEQADAHASGDEEAHHYDADYILALEHGLPPTVGVGIGIDRLVMVLTNTTSIKEVILFPTLKKKDAE